MNTANIGSQTGVPKPDPDDGNDEPEFDPDFDLPEPDPEDPAQADIEDVPGVKPSGKVTPLIDPAWAHLSEQIHAVVCFRLSERPLIEFSVKRLLRTIQGCRWKSIGSVGRDFAQNVERLPHSQVTQTPDRADGRSRSTAHTCRRVDPDRPGAAPPLPAVWRSLRPCSGHA